MWWGHSPGDKLRGGKRVKRERLKIQGRMIEKEEIRKERGKKGAEIVEKNTGPVEAKKATWSRFLADSPYLLRLLPR